MTYDSESVSEISGPVIWKLTSSCTFSALLYILVFAPKWLYSPGQKFTTHFIQLICVYEDIWASSWFTWRRQVTRTRHSTATCGVCTAHFSREVLGFQARITRCPSRGILAPDSGAETRFTTQSRERTSRERITSSTWRVNRTLFLDLQRAFDRV